MLHAFLLLDFAAVSFDRLLLILIAIVVIIFVFVEECACILDQVLLDELLLIRDLFQFSVFFVCISDEEEAIELLPNQLIARYRAFIMLDILVLLNLIDALLFGIVNDNNMTTTLDLGQCIGHICSF